MALGVTAYLFRKSETARRAEARPPKASTAARVAARDVLELRAAQRLRRHRTG
jgi:hypothetical protein